MAARDRTTGSRYFSLSVGANGRSGTDWRKTCKRGMSLTLLAACGLGHVARRRREQRFD
jgi:hypothetical protein